MSITRLSCTIYPDRTFSLGVVPSPKKRPEDAQYEHSWRNQPETDYGAVADWLEGKTNIGGAYQSLSERVAWADESLTLRKVSDHDMSVLTEMDKITNGDFSAFYEVEPPSEAPLLVKSLKSSRESRNPYGSNGITTYGKRLVKNATLLLERKYGKGRLGFVTCSLPSLPEREHHLLNGCWGEVVRRFYQKLKRQLKKVSRPFEYIGVTEIQEKRFHKHGIPAPHLHFVYLSRTHSRQRYWLYICQIHRAWNQAVQEGLAYAGSSFSMESTKSWGVGSCKAC